MSPEEFRQLLERKGAAVECPVCGADDWRGLDDVIDLPVRTVGPTPDEAHVRIPGFAALAPSCGRCGHVRLIDLRLLGASLRYEREPDQDRTPPQDVELPAADAGEGSRGGQRLTNLWGAPISKRRRKSS
jgi:hypothetical protein